MADARLNYRLNPTLGTRASYRLERVDASSLERESQRADFQLQHRLYESLITTVAVRGSIDHLPTGRRGAYGGSLLGDYRKRLPADGRLTIRGGGTYDRADNRFSGREDAVLDEAHTARFGAPIRLRGSRIIPASIEIADASRSTIFLESVDYTVEFIGEFAEINILPSGRIQDGHAIRVDYRIAASPFTSILTTQPVFDLSVDYGWISPHFRFQRVDRRLLNGFDDGSVFGRTTRAAGVRLRGALRDLRVTLNGERRSEDARNLSLDVIQFGQTLSYAFGAARALNVNLSQVVTRFHLPSRRESLGSGSVDFGWQATPILSIQATALTRRRRDSFGADEDFHQASIEARWQRAKFDMSASIGRSWGRRVGRPFDGLRSAIGLTRSFG